SHLFGGWRVSGIFTASSGVPVGPKLRGRNAPDLSRAANNQRPELMPGRTVENMTTGVTAGCLGLPGGQKLGTPDLYFDPCAFTVPPPGFYGNAGRNSIIGPGFFNVDFSLSKSIPIGISEESRLQVHADLFNLANHPNFGRPEQETIVQSTGRVQPGAGEITETVSSERQIQFGLKFIF
ncbi:MAG: hypothetical protein ACRD88_03625, partial [Terriglobia bacterium]